MVSTRIVIAASAFLLTLAIGSEWIAFQSGYVESGYTTLGISEHLGSIYGPCACPPSNSTVEGWFWHVMAPLLIAPGALSFAIVTFPLGFLLAVVSLFKWKLMVVAGALSILSGISWIEGLNIVQSQVVHELGASSAVWAQPGPYIAVFGGVILLAGYALSKMEKLELPTD